VATLNVGKLRVNWKGAYNASTAYEVNDAVSYQGSSYIAITATTNNLPTVTTNWNKMAEGTNPLTTSGDIMTHNGSSAIRLPAGAVGQSLQVTGSNTLGYASQKGFEGIDVLEANVPLYANTTNTTLFGTDGKYPWLAQYNGKSGANADWIPQDGMPNGACGPVKRPYDEMMSSYTSCMWINTNHEIMQTGYMSHGIGAFSNGSYNPRVQIVGNLSMENGGMAADEKFVRIWYTGNSAWALTNKGNVWCIGENSNGALGLGHTTDTFQWVRNPYLGPDATNNSITCEVSCIAISDPRGYQAMGNNRVFVILHDGRVMSWGWGGNGAHGLGNTTNTSVPTIVSGLTGIVSLSLGYNESYAVKSDGTAYHSGANVNSVSSLGSARTSFAQMTAVSNCQQILSASTYYYNGGIDASGYYIDTTGNLYGIGNNGVGQLANGNTTDQSSWIQIGGSENFSAVQTSGNNSTLSVLAWLGNTAGQDGPGDMYTYTIAANTGMPFRMFGYNGNGQHMQGDTTANQSVRTPSTGTFGDYHNTVNSSADGTVSRTALTFPRNNMISCFPARTSGYNSPMWWGLDTQGRTWVWGYMAQAYEYRANTGAESFNKAFLYPAPMQHTLTGQTQWWVGDIDKKFTDIVSCGHYYSGYWTHFANTTTADLYMIGNNYYYQHGCSQNVHHHFWHKRNP
tara:strand:- start:475 stop:2517 length:2043 start_codon:yes stop_codon:yes gene_type:complete